MKFNRKVLDNGLTVLHEKRNVPVTTVMLAAKYGAAYETEKEKGIAHFIEHLCFKGTKRRTTKQIAYELEKVGGYLNAFTDEEETAYYCTLPSQELGLATDVIFDIFFNPVFPSKEVKKEANVICEEIKRSMDNPLAYAFRKFKGCLYKKPFGMFIAGTEENVRNMTKKQLLEKHREIYTPENSILSVVGDNNLEDVIELAEKFSVSRKGKIQKPKKKVLQTLKEEEKRPALQQATLMLGFHFPTAVSEERYAAKVFSRILGGGMSSKLFTEVREKRGLAYSISSSLDMGRDFGYLLVHAGTNKTKVNEVIEISLDEFKKMKKISKKELKDGKRQLVGNYEVGRESSDAVATGMIYREIAGRASTSKGYKEEVEKVSLEGIVKLTERSEYASFVLSP